MPAVLETMDDDSREFEYSARDFKRVRDMIYARAGIALSDSKVDMVYSRLARRLREVDMERFCDYLDALEADANSPEWEKFTNALTTNLTSFYREAHHFEILSRFLLKRRSKPGGERMLIWCSAASTGEEPYTLAMTAVETFGTLTPPVSILATDIDTQVLQTAEAGVYPLDRIERLSSERTKRFFLRGSGARSGYVKVNEALRRLITFRQLNLLDPSWPLRGPFDAIFCRNVMIYFDKQTQHEILQKMKPLLKADGLFFAGHSESFHHAADLFKPCGRSVYEPVSYPVTPTLNVPRVSAGMR
jgi:chemotaxis protein methyltransferase CheR